MDLVDVTFAVSPREFLMYFLCAALIYGITGTGWTVIVRSKYGKPIQLYVLACLWLVWPIWMGLELGFFLHHHLKRIGEKLI